MIDPRQLAIPGAELERVSEGPALAAVRAAMVALERVANPNRKNTRKSYEKHWELWGDWCDLTGTAPFPVEPLRLVAHLEWLSNPHPVKVRRSRAPSANPRKGNSTAGPMRVETRTSAPNSVRHALAAIASLDVERRITPTDQNPISVAISPVVRRWLKSWSRENPRAPRKKAACIEKSGLWRLLEVINEPTPRCARAFHAMRACRDRAMVLIGIYGGLRVSELVALDVPDLRFTHRGLELRLKSSKTDQAGDGKWKGILPASARGICAVDAWKTWLTARGAGPGPAFLSIARNGELGTDYMATRTTQLMITRHAKRAGLELVSSHSMRATIATLAGLHGHDIAAVADHLDHASLQTTAGYMRRGSLFSEKNPTAGLFDGD